MQVRWKNEHFLFSLVWFFSLAKANVNIDQQTQADLVGIPVNQPRIRETTTLGATIAAGFAAGVWKHFDDLKNIKMGGRFYFEPKMPENESKRIYRRWEKAVAEAVSVDNSQVMPNRILDALPMGFPC